MLKEKRAISFYVFVIILFYHCSICLAAGKTSSPAKGGARTGLEKKISAILGRKVLDNAQVGIHVVSLKDNNEILYKRNEGKLFSIASNTKLFTTAAALVYLGPRYGYKTIVYKSGKVSPTGVLEGDIIIKGSGDPNLSGRFNGGRVTAVPESWASKVKDAGIDVVNGDIVADDRVFDREYIPPTWPSNQLSKWYCAEVGGLSFNDNCIDYKIGPGKKVGHLVRVSIEPDTSFVKIYNKCKTTSKSSKRSYSVERKPGTNEITIRGKIPANSASSKGWVTIHNPGLYLATVFKEILKKQGVKVRGIARIINPDEYSDANGLHVITQTVSTMGQSVNIANSRSQNFYAEQILKTLGFNLKGEGGFASGIEVIHGFMHSLGYEREQYQMLDGSGLSRGNKFSPKMITSLLAYMYNHKHYHHFIQSLAVPGDKEGSLRNRLRGIPDKSRVRAKSGYIYGAVALSGYIETMSDDVLAFSILVNDFKTRAKMVKDVQDSICKVLVECG
jgi:D-alanyl-D-alanine carboxypeptidase/D-alanyl-D-alanine-endopeptidase (penicillin-binding protein 4)